MGQESLLTRLGRAFKVWLAVIILGRDVGLGIAAVYYRWISLPPPKTFSRYWDFSLPSAEVRPTTISKYNTFLQLALMGLTTLAPVSPVDLASSLTVLQWVYLVLPPNSPWNSCPWRPTRSVIRVDSSLLPPGQPCRKSLRGRC